MATTTTPLATLSDYLLRHGPCSDPGRTTQQLADAESLVRHEAGLTISKVTDDTIEVDGDRSRLLILPEFPVIGVTTVTVDEVDLVDGTDFEWTSWGGLDRLTGWWPCRPRSVEVTYDHGWDPCPAWVTALVCAMVQRATLPHLAAGVSSETTGSQAVSFVASAGGVSLWLIQDEVDRLKALRGATVV